MAADPLDPATPTYSSKLKALVEELQALKASVTSRLTRKLGTNTDNLEIPALVGKQLQALRVNSGATGLEFAPVANITLPTPVPNSLLGWDATGTMYNATFSSIGSTVAGDLTVAGIVYFGSTNRLYIGSNVVYQYLSFNNAITVGKGFTLRYISDETHKVELLDMQSQLRYLDVSVDGGTRIAGLKQRLQAYNTNYPGPDVGDHCLQFVGGTHGQIVKQHLRGSDSQLTAKYEAFGQNFLVARRNSNQILTGSTWTAFVNSTYNTYTDPDSLLTGVGFIPKVTGWYQLTLNAVLTTGVVFRCRIYNITDAQLVETSPVAQQNLSWASGLVYLAKGKEYTLQIYPDAACTLDAVSNLSMKLVHPFAV